MAALTTDHLVMWFGTNASVPSGWTKYSTANDRCFQGAESSLETQAGSDSHTHATSSHSSGVDAHTHQVSAGYTLTGAVATKGTAGSPAQAYAQYVLLNGHLHPATTSSFADASPYADSSLNNISSENHLPATTNCILIHPTSGTKELPDDASVFLDSGTLPTGYTWHDGVGAAIDLTDDFIKGVNDASTDDGGSTTAGGPHTHTTTNHKHAGQSHGHGSFAAGTAPEIASKAGAGKGSEWPGNHHTVNLAPTTPADTTFQNPSSDATSVEPPYVKLMAAQNTSGGDNSVAGMICLYKGSTPGSVTDWDLCDGTGGTQDLDGKFVKVTNTSGHIGNTGGTSTHQHLDEFSHTHAASAGHTHTVGSVSMAARRKILAGAIANSAYTKTGHTFGDHTWTCSTDSPTFSASTVTTSFDSHLPKNVTLAFLKYNPVTSVKIVSLGGHYNEAGTRHILI